jgi:hypothetical protein
MRKVLDGQTGKRLFVFDLYSKGIPNLGMTLSITRHGEYIAFNNGNITYVLNRDGTLRGTPVDKVNNLPALLHFVFESLTT